MGQVQSIIKKITVNFQNAGKKVINSNNIELKMRIEIEIKKIIKLINTFFDAVKFL